MKSLLGTSALAAVLALGGLSVANAQAQNQQQQDAQGQQPSGNAGANIHVREPAPKVTVQEQQPQVQVQQPKPDVVVRQPQPDVTVNQPKPEVAVQQPKPQVTVQQPKPDVTVHEAQPNVTVQRQGQPNVDVNRTGQTDVKVERGTQQGQQQHGKNEQHSQGQQQDQQQQATNQGMSLVAVKSLIGKQVKTTSGDDAGEIQNLLIGPAGKVQAAVVEWGGGIFGIGSNQNVVPIKDIQLAGNQARVDLTKDELKQLPTYDRNNMSQYGDGWHAYQ